MSTTTDQPNGRRSFLKLVGAVLGAGAGLAITGAASAETEQTGRGAGTDACAVWCKPLGGSCQYCGTGRYWFTCTSVCGGSWSQCFQRSCTGFCFSQSAC